MVRSPPPLGRLFEDEKDRLCGGGHGPRRRCRLRRDQLGRRAREQLNGGGSVGNGAEPHYHLSGNSGARQPALPGRGGRRGRDHFEPQSVSRHRDRVNLPTSTTYATGYTTSALTTTQSGCLSTTPSDVIWNYSTTTSGSAHTLTTPLVVGAIGNANDPLTVTLTNDASMTASAPAACENTYFSMPSLTGIAASGGAGTVTTTPATDAWTS